MRLFTVTGNMDNAAFDDGEGGGAEVVRLLRELADRIESDGVPEHLRLFDINGNHIGYFQSKTL